MLMRAASNFLDAPIGARSGHPDHRYDKYQADQPKHIELLDDIGKVLSQAENKHTTNYQCPHDGDHHILPW